MISKVRIPESIKQNPKKAALLLIMIGHILFSQLYDDSNDLLFTDERSIEIGKKSALAGFFGDEEKIKQLSHQSSEASHQSGCSVDYVDTLKLNPYLHRKYFDLINDSANEGDAPENRAHLLKLEKIGDYFAIASYQIKTAYNDELWAKNIPAVVSVAMKYTGNHISPTPSFLRKSLNASYLPALVRRYVSGDWHAEMIVSMLCAKGYFNAAEQNEANIPSDEIKYNIHPNMTEQEALTIGNSMKENAINNLNKTYEEAMSTSITQNLASINALRIKKGLPALPPIEK